jgi:uncharacterized lipoprotein YajG
MRSVGRRKRLLYVALHDGADVRVTKELCSLSEAYEIHFLGMSADARPYAENCLARCIIIKGRRLAPSTMIGWWLTLLRLRLRYEYDSIHVVNEQTLLCMNVLVCGCHTVLDIFDSMFLKKNVNPLAALLLRAACYLSVQQIITTDSLRREMLPSYARSRALVIPNYPRKADLPRRREDRAARGTLRIFVGGALHEQRGLELAAKLASAAENVIFVVAGWLNDAAAKRFITMDVVEWHGVVDASSALRLASKCDYIWCLYDPCNANNINASPNKLYDAICIHVPVVMNAEVVHAQFVDKNRLGVLVDRYRGVEPHKLYSVLWATRATWKWSDEFAADYCWDNKECELLAAHHHAGCAQREI